MIYRASVYVAAFCLLASLLSWAGAQTLNISKFPPAAKESNEKIVRSKRAEPDSPEDQRTSAVSLLTSLAQESNTFSDQTLRVRIQARAADALWDSDRRLGRDLFYRAWETAESADKESERVTTEARRQVFTSHQGLTFIPPSTNLRLEVLYLAARRDGHLGEDLLARFEEAEGREAPTEPDVTGSQSSFSDPTEPAAAIANRLEVATKLLTMGEVVRAKMFADPGLKKVTSHGIIFLGTLRQADAGAADERYSRLLRVTAKEPSGDATAISLLASYVLTPNLLVTATRRGRVSNRWSDVALAPNPPAGLRDSFLKVAAGVLLRPLPPQEEDRTSAGRAGTYFTIARLLPVYERYAPDQLPALSARLAVLAPDTPEAYRNNENGMLTAGIVLEGDGKNDLSDILSQLSGTAGMGARDLIYAKAVRAAAIKGDGRIREFADRIENTDLRKRARSFADFVAVRKALDEKDVEGAMRITGAGELPPIHRVWAYTEAAGLLRKSDAPRAIQLLTEATSAAHTINNGELERVHALMCVASHFFKLDRARAWEMTADAVKASNAASNFTADDGKLTARFSVRDVMAQVNLDVPSFNLTNLFELLAKDDFSRANSVANSLKGEAPRATARLAIARSLLRK